MHMSSGYKRPGIFTELLHLTSCVSLGNLFKPPNLTFLYFQYKENSNILQMT